MVSYFSIKVIKVLKVKLKNKMFVKVYNYGVKLVQLYFKSNLCLF